MPHKRHKAQTTSKSNEMRAEVFLRSINLRYDAEEPDRIAHFQPTAKSIPLLKALAGQENDRAFFVVAPYGSGKSLTAAYLLHLVENRPESTHTLIHIEKKLRQVSPEFSRFAAERCTQKDTFGLVLVLHGYCSSLGQGIKGAALEAIKRRKLGRRIRKIGQMPCDDMEQTIALLAELREKASRAGCDRIILIWDEFGRHVQFLLAEAQSAALIEIQTLAEFISRSREIPMTLGLLLHQGLLHYAGNIPQTIRAEWTKIEGRFQTIQYIDDSKEIYRLIGEVVSSRVPRGHPSVRTISSAAAACKRLGLFTDFIKSELEELLKRAYPLEPTTLYLLPRISARVAQNERTLFNFLYNADLQDPVSPEVLYHYFSSAMRADTAVGGTYRQWLETQSALSKVDGDERATTALEVACLLGLGTGGERSRAKRDLLLFALRGYGKPNREEAVVDHLIKQKLLLYRKHNDEVSVWHGTDIDLRGRLEEEKRRHRDQFNLLDFLTHEAPPPTWRPVEYNDDFAVRRYLTGAYHSMETLNAYLKVELPREHIPVGCDGKVLYLITETNEELRQAEIVRNQLKHERVVLAIPREPLSLFEAALEVWCLIRMQHDGALVESDPFVMPELQQMTDDAHGHLQQLIDQLILPGPKGPRWFYRGCELKIERSRDLRRTLSNMMREVFHLTPKINNEMIVRNKPSSPIVNARKKLVLGILERSGKENLGIQGNFPDALMFRTVLLHTGLYCQDKEGRWGYAPPGDIKDPGLRAVWEKIQEFLTTPARRPKDLSELFNQLREPPFGVRAGLLPILFSAGLRAFPSARSLTKEGRYITDILPTEIEELCKEPASYRLLVLNMDENRRAYLRGFYPCFNHNTTQKAAETDLIRMCFDALEAWKLELPPAALTTKRLSDRARRFQALLRREMNPVQLLFDKIPEACGYPIEQQDRLLEVLAQCKKELMGVAKTYRDHAAVSVCRTLALVHQDNNWDVRKMASRWTNCFSDGFVENLTDGIAKSLLSRMGMPYKSDELLLNSLASLLVGKPLSRWDDSTVAAFDREMHNVVRRIENIALSFEGSVPDQGIAIQGLAELARGRITELFDRLVNLVGTDEAEAMLSSILAEQKERNNRGDHKRSLK